MEVWGGNGAAEDALAVPGIDAWVWTRPYGGSEAGGDLHYASVCGQGRISRFAIADAVGHGEMADRLAQDLRRLMRKHVHTLDQSRLARALNRGLTRLGVAAEFVTALLTAYHPPTDHLVVCNAGHPPPLWYRASQQQWELLEEDTPARETRVRNLPFGIIHPTDYVQFAVKLEPGDLVLLYTDALIEARCPSGEPIGEQGLLEIAQETDPAAPQNVIEWIVDELERYRGGRSAEDDQTLLLLHHNGANPPTPSMTQRMRAMADMMVQAVA